LGISRETLTGADWAPLWVKIIIENQKIRKSQLNTEKVPMKITENPGIGYLKRRGRGKRHAQS
jgi:hypothetical protein